MNVKLSSVQDVLRGERTTIKIDKDIMTSVKVKLKYALTRTAL